jgi:hypothetical protein
VFEVFEVLRGRGAVRLRGAEVFEGFKMLRGRGIEGR